jgi:hypothetical protein
MSSTKSCWLADLSQLAIDPSAPQANITRDFINGLNDGQHRMPTGPVIISPHGLLPSLYRSVLVLEYALVFFTLRIHYPYIKDS